MNWNMNPPPTTALWTMTKSEEAYPLAAPEDLRRYREAGSQSTDAEPSRPITDEMVEAAAVYITETIDDDALDLPFMRGIARAALEAAEKARVS